MDFLMKSSRLIVISKTYARRVTVPIPRMGSFNTAPKINNVDCQDDGLELPKNLSAAELLNHVRQLHGQEQPALLNRHFVRSSPLTNFYNNSHAAADVRSNLNGVKLDARFAHVYSAPEVTQPLANQLRILQWNVLSQTLSQHNDSFVCCPDEALTWEHRKFLIVQELLQHNPDVICLQEVDHFKFLQTVLGSQNYTGIFFPKPDSPCLYIEENNGPDGCAIFYKRDKLELQEFDTRVLEIWRVQSNQVAIAARLRVMATGREFCVCTTHLKARHGSLLAKLRNEQGRDLVRFVQKFAGVQPIVLCGDFNAEPIEPIYSTLLNSDKLKLSSAYADINQPVVGQSADNCHERTEFVRESMKCEPPYTTWKIREDGEECHTIDYVFYTKDHLKVLNCLEFPCGETIGKNRTPSLQYPSDHFSLVCDFELLDPTTQSKANL